MIFNESLKNKRTIEGEAIRLYLEIKGGQTFNSRDLSGKPMKFTTPIGIDLNVCTLIQLKNYKPKSNAQKFFKERMIKIRNNEITENLLIELGKSGLSKNSKLYPSDL